MPTEHEAIPWKLEHTSLTGSENRIKISQPIRQHLGSRRRTASFQKSLHRKRIAAWMLEQKNRPSLTTEGPSKPAEMIRTAAQARHQHKPVTAFGRA